MEEKYNKRWPVIQDILKREGIARQHLNSFDEFLENGLQQIITEVNQIEIENAEYPYKIQLEKTLTNHKMNSKAINAHTTN